MRLEELLSEPEIQTPRRPHIFLEWFEALLRRIHAINDDQLNRQVLTRAGIAKQMYEELFPLYRLLQEKRNEWASISVRNVLGNQAGDVEIISHGADSGKIPEKLEITYAVSGRDHMLRMGHLADHGWTSMSGPLSELGQGGQKITRIEVGCSAVEEKVAEVFKLVRRRIGDKVKKKYGQKTGLVVYIEDDGTFQHSIKHQARLEALGVEYLSQLKRAFCAVYLILASNGKVIELDLVALRRPKLGGPLTDIAIPT